LLEDEYDGRTCPLSTNKADLDNDWIAVRVDTSSNATERSAISVDQPEAWEPLLFISYNIHALTIDHVLREADPEMRSLLDPLRPDIDMSPLCRAAIVEGSIFMHACQTEVRSSGSAFFALRGDDTPVLVGIQAGGSELVRNQCTSDVTDNFPNYAVVLPKFMRKAINDE